MSSGGRRGVDVSGGGILGQGMRIQNASDVTYQTKVQLIYTTNNANSSNTPIGVWGGRNAYQSHTPNGNDFVRQFLAGWRECDCSGGIPRLTTGNITPFV
jgi:hypothetical protein